MAPVSGKTLLFACAAAAAFLAAAALLVDVADRGFSYVAREPASALSDSSCAGAECGLAGMVATVTSLVWLFGAAVALLAAALLRRAGASPSDLSRMLVLGGLLTVVMGLDDLFLIHDYVLDELSGYAAEALPAVYGIAALAVFRLAWRSVDRRDLALLVVGGGLLGVSAALDRLWDAAPYLVEDGLKVFGVVAWTAFLVSAAVAAVDGVVAPVRRGQRSSPERPG